MTDSGKMDNDVLSEKVNVNDVKEGIVDNVEDADGVTQKV
jgi:hypothetical protein